jgi:HEAT repeat protein
MPDQATGSNNELASRVEKAFAAARQGDFGPSSDLVSLGPAVVPLLEPFLGDPSEDVRRQAVDLLKAMPGAAAIPLLAKALADPSEDIRDRASLQLYANYKPEQLAAGTMLGAALRQSIEAGNDSAAAVLLLGYFPSTEAVRTLENLLSRTGDSRTELFAWSPVVPVALAANVSLSRLGNRKARASLLKEIESSGLAELQFLLAVIREIDAPEALHALKRTLGDTRGIGGGAPAGAQTGRRLCDAAVDAFIGRLGLKVNFSTSASSLYSEPQIESVRRAINSAVPQ